MIESLCTFRLAHIQYTFRSAALTESEISQMSITIKHSLFSHLTTNSSILYTLQAKISSKTHVQLLQWLHGKQKQHRAYIRNCQFGNVKVAVEPVQFHFAAELKEVVFSLLTSYASFSTLQEQFCHTLELGFLYTGRTVGKCWIWSEDPDPKSLCYIFLKCSMTKIFLHKEI